MDDEKDQLIQISGSGRLVLIYNSCISSISQYQLEKYMLTNTVGAIEGAMVMTSQPSRYRCDTCVNNCSWRGRVNFGFIRDMGCASHSAFVSYEQLMQRLKIHSPIEGTYKGWVMLSEVENTLKSIGHFDR